MECVALLIWSAPFISRGGWEVVLHVREGQNHLFTSHFLHLHCGEDGAGGAWRPLLRRRVPELFRRCWSWRGRLLAMKREGQGWLRLSLSRPSSSSPTRVSSSNPSRRRWIFSFPSSLRRSSRSWAIPGASSAASYASFVGGARPSLLLSGHKDPTMVASSDVELSSGNGGRLHQVCRYTSRAPPKQWLPLPLPRPRLRAPQPQHQPADLECSAALSSSAQLQL
jgi:hypothetical protein